MNQWDKKNSFPGVSFEADAETKALRSMGHNNSLSLGIYLSILGGSAQASEEEFPTSAN